MLKQQTNHIKKLVILHLISLAVLLLEFALCRFVFFSLHGMKEWPAVLLFAGIAVLVLSLFTKKQYVPVFTAFGYFLGFLAGVLFSSEGQDPGGARSSNLWIIWTIVFAACILVGIIAETARKWWKLTRNYTIMK